MRIRLGLAAAALALLAGCAAPAPTEPAAAPPGDQPAAGTAMVCSPEIRDQATVYLGAVPELSPPTWADHLYTCRWTYPGATITLSIKELTTPEETTAYVQGLADRYGQGPAARLGDGAFVTTGGSMVMHKDNKVMLVDTSDLPATFGDPPVDRATAAQLVTAVIAACWTGA